MAGKTKARPYKKGRPTKRTDRLEAKLEEYLVMGLPRWAACALVGISRQCFSEWMHQVPGFKEKVESYEARALSDMVQRVKREPRGNQYLLSRRFRDDYGDKLAVEVEQRGPLPVRFVDYKDGIEAPPAEAGSSGDSLPPGETEVAV